VPEVPAVKYLRVLIAVAGLCAISCSKKSIAEEPAKPSPSPSAPASKAGWLTSLADAQQQAKARQKLLLLDFTGSDWCGWCIKLDREIFSKPEFKEYANKNLVLLEVDFPQRKQLPPELVAQNERLAVQYRIQGFPTILVLDSEGKPVGALGYTPGGPQAFIAELERLRKS
jgi:protein disulfide-isomerase